MSGFEIVGSVIFVMFVAFWTGRYTAPKAPPVALLERLAEGDLRELLRKLRPLTRHNMPTDASITIWSTGEISLHARLLNGSEVRASADTLEGAKLAVSRQATEIAEVFAATDAP